MTYQIIQPPFTLKFREMSKAELKDYFQWFQSVIPERMQILADFVRETELRQNWKMDLTPASLGPLGKWQERHAEMRRRTAEEVREIQFRSAQPIVIPEEELTNRTFSLAMDIGMYLSLVFLKNYPELKWTQSFGAKASVDYGQPVLAGFGTKTFNPVRMLVTLSYGLANGTKTGDRLRELYDIWAGMIPNGRA